MASASMGAHSQADPEADGGISATGAQGMHELIQLRWIAVIGQVVTILTAHYGLGIQLPLLPMLLLVAGLALFNLASQLHWRRRPQASAAAVLVSLLVDVALLTVQLHFSGGIGNPFVFLYLLQVVLGAALLRTPLAWAIVAATGLCLLLLIAFPGPVSIPPQAWVLGLVLCFVLNAVLVVVFSTRISRIGRARDARLAALRQRAAEEDHILRMGLLASGAAHELGTPLATISVILGDWQRLPAFTSDPELLADVGEMQAQVRRCKSIVTGILLSAGETRGEAPTLTTVHRFFGELVTSWRQSRRAGRLEYDNRFGPDLAIISDAGLAQMVGNVLDNALEASPDWLALSVSRQEQRLVITVDDAGAGFDAAMLAHLGQPYRSSKGRPGRGLGLFLSLNVARTLGGTLSARNRDGGRGASVVMSLPLSSLTNEADEDEP
ncbi:MAG: ATP-binding protein [Lysobacterales bacterium]